jgi:WD40 repeat protein
MGKHAQRRSFFVQQRLSVIAAVIVFCLLLGSVLVVFSSARQVGIGSHQALPTATTGGHQRGATLFTYHDPASVYAVGWSPDGQRIATTSNAVRVWDRAMKRQLLTLAPQPANSFFVARWSPDGTRIAANTPVLALWNATTGQRQVSCPDPFKLISSTGGNADKQLIPVVNGSSDAENMDPVPVPGTIDWSPDGRYIAQTYQNVEQPMVVVWNVTNCKLVARYKSERNELPLDVAWSPDGKHIAFSVDRAVKVWDYAADKVVYTYHDPFETNIYRLAWSPDSKRIATASYGSNTVEVWDATTGGHPVIYRGHARPVFALAWSPDGTALASGSSVRQGTTLTGEVRVWGAVTSQLIYLYQGHAHPVLAVAWSPDGKLIASSDGKLADTTGQSSDGNVKVWSVA